jgi:GT2 family glycosyltransferase/uncharacterized protein YbaR (Trm112 family)/SAM-dependent methyltransferase
VRPEHRTLLCCPDCHGNLDLAILKEEQGDILEGIFRCLPCQRIYPLINGIPRMLPNSLIGAVEFCATYESELAQMGFNPNQSEIRQFEKLHRKTARAFGFEWNTYQVTTPEEDMVTLAALTGFDLNFYRKVFFADIFTHVPTEQDVRNVDTSFLKGRTVIEMGCGMGKYVQTVARYSRLAVGLDLSNSLDRARENMRHMANVLLVQGNILQPPFRPESFDYVYSVGVLHHTPDCRLAFKRSASLVKPGGRLSVWLYPTERQTGVYARAVHFVQDGLIRPVTCRMPPEWLYQVCRLLGKMTFWRDAAAVRGRRRLAQFLALFAVGGHTDRKIAEFLNFDWYSPQYRSYHSEDELLQWFPQEGFEGVTILPMRTSGIAIKALAGTAMVQSPPPRMLGCVDYPNGKETLVAGDNMLVQGWAFDVAGHSPIIEIFVDDEKVKELQCFSGRVDVKQAFPDVHHALYCGYNCHLRVRRSWAPRARVKITARSAACAPAVLAEHVLEVSTRPLATALALRIRRVIPTPIKRLVRRIRHDKVHSAAAAQPNPDRYSRWLEVHESGLPLPHICEASDPLISIIVPVHDTPARFLRELLDSIAVQTCERWELCAVDDGSISDEAWRILEHFAAQHPRVHLDRRESAGGIAVASNLAIAAASGAYIAFCDHDDLLRSDAMAQLSEAIRNNPGVDVIYSDHDILEPDGRRSEPRLKPNWSPDLLRSYMYWGHIKCFRKALVQELGGLRAEFPGAEDYDLALRISEKTDRIVHVPQVLYHWRRHDQSTSSGGTQKEYSIHSGVKAISQHLARSGIQADVVWPDRSRKAGVGLFRLDFRHPSYPTVAVIIPTRDRLDLLSRCISSLETITDYPAMEVIIADNGSKESETLDYFSRTAHRVISLPMGGRFNFSAIINAAIAETQAEYVLFLNNDTEITAADWLQRMVGFARMPGVGAVGAKLLYPDGRIQHLGVVMGHEGLTGHYFQGEPNDSDLGYQCYKYAVRNVAAVTAACMLTPRHLFLQMGGLDQTDLQVAWNDVDYCLRLLQHGYRVVVDPDVVLLHHEGASRGEAKNTREIAFMMRHWRSIIASDPYYHRGFALTGPTFTLRNETIESEAPRLYYFRHAGADSAREAALIAPGDR